MAFDPKPQNYTPDDHMPEDYYNKGVNGFLSVVGASIASAANWRFFACGLLLFALTCLASTVYFATRSTIVPYIVEVDSRTGAVISSSKVLARAQADSRQFEYFVWQVIRKTRTLPKDIVLYKENWTEAYTFMNSEVSQKFNDMAIRENHQTKLAEGRTTMLSLKSITAVAGREDTFNVRWIEVNYDNDGRKLGEYELEGYFNLEQVPLDEKTVYYNPLGIRIKDFSMSQSQQ